MVGCAKNGLLCPVPVHQSSCLRTAAPCCSPPTAQSISVVTRHRKTCVNFTCGADQSNLLSIQPSIQNSTPSDITPVPSPAAVKFGLFNTRSLSNKSFLINDLIRTHKLDLLLTETWLDMENATTLIESAPRNSDFMSVIRKHGRGGGIAQIFKNSFQTDFLCQFF